MTWRYIFADLRTDRTIDEIELAGPSFDVRISDAGTFSATVPIANAERAARIRQLEEGRTVVYAMRNGVIWSGPYILWSITPSGDGRGRISVQMQGSDLPSYLQRREIRETYSAPATDQLLVAADIVNLAQQQRPPGNLLVDVPYESSGILRDVFLRPTEGQTWGQALADLAAREDGFEYRFSSSLDPYGYRMRHFLVGYPRLGKDEAEHVFAQPGDVLAWSRVGDASEAATSFRARGASIHDELGPDGGGDVALLGDVAYRDDLLEAGWPVLDRTDDYPDVKSRATLTAYARARAAERGGTVRILSVSVRLGPDSITPANLGDRARVKLRNDWFHDPPLSESWRIIGIGMTPSARGAGQDTAQLIFENTDGAAA